MGFSQTAYALQGHQLIILKMKFLLLFVLMTTKSTMSLTAGDCFCSDLTLEGGIGKCHADFCFIPSWARCTDAKQYKFSSGLLTSKKACKDSSSIEKGSGSGTGAGGGSGTGADGGSGTGAGGGSDTAPAPTPCECSNITRKDHLDRHIGRCLTEQEGKFWCYVSSTATCSDIKKSLRTGGLFWSFSACESYTDSAANTGR